MKQEDVFYKLELALDPYIDLYNDMLEAKQNSEDFDYEWYFGGFYYEIKCFYKYIFELQEDYSVTIEEQEVQQIMKNSIKNNDAYKLAAKLFAEVQEN